jgi:hypothetical protein
MKLFCIYIQHIIIFFAFLVCCRCRPGFIQAAVAGFIIDHNPRLHIIAVYIEANALAIIFHRKAFHQDSGGNQIVPVKAGSHTI